MSGFMNRFTDVVPTTIPHTITINKPTWLIFTGTPDMTTGSFAQSPEKFNMAALNRIRCMLRVNHAGEVGADAIYAGQSARIPPESQPHGPIIQHMVAHPAFL